jgi:hypothetical protein
MSLYLSASLGNDLEVLEATGTSDITTTSTSFILATNMTLTPTAGVYLAIFTADVAVSTNNAQLHIEFYLNGAAIANTDAWYRAIGTLAPSDRQSLCVNRIITTPGNQSIELRWRVTAGTGTMGQARSLHLIRIR